MVKLRRHALVFAQDEYDLSINSLIIDDLHKRIKRFVRTHHKQVQRESCCMDANAPKRRYAMQFLIIGLPLFSLH